MSAPIIYNPGTSTDFLAAWDWDNFFFLNIHALFDANLNDAHTIHFFYGPGGFIGIHEKPGKNKIDLGISGNFGLDFIIKRFETADTGASTNVESWMFNI